MLKKVTLYAFSAVLFLTSQNRPGFAQENLKDEIVVDRFSGEAEPSGLPKGWKPFLFPKKKKLTVYTVEREGDSYAVKADSRESASAIYKEMDLDIREYPVLKWRWKIAGVIKNAKEGRKEGDDYPARIYVTFKYEPEKAAFFDKIKYAFAERFYGIKPPGNAITYIWASRLKKGECLPNPFTEKVMMMAVESGEENCGRWVEEERDVYEDYKKIFGSEPPRVTGVALMTDSDNTKESATAWYGDIIFKKKPGHVEASN